MKIAIFVDVELGDLVNGLTRVRVSGKNERDRILGYDETRTIRWEDYANTEMTVGALVMEAVRELSDDDD